MALDRVVVRAEDEDAGRGRGADDVVDDPGAVGQLVGGEARARPPRSACRPRPSGRACPRRATRMPVALATIACSNEIFVPSANDVTICGFCPHRAANSSCVVGLRYGS